MRVRPRRRPSRRRPRSLRPHLPRPSRRLKVTSPIRIQSRTRRQRQHNHHPPWNGRFRSINKPCGDRATTRSITYKFDGKANTATGTLTPTPGIHAR